MIQVGEESVELDSLLMTVADPYDIETRNAIDRMVALLVPALTMGMALVIAIIILSVLMPIYDMTGNMG
jgi:general secretion pathway protein F